MGTRRRDAQHRQVSLAVEALEDRFLLSSVASLSIPAVMSGPLAFPAPAHVSVAPNETRSVTPREMPGYPAAGQILALPVNPIMSSPREQGSDDDDPPGKTDGDASHNIALWFSLLCSGNNSAGELDSALPSRSPEQMTLPAANLMTYPPLLSASGLGVAKTISLPPIIPSTAVSEYAPGDHGPAPGKEERRPMPAAPETPPATFPPLVEEPAGPPPSSGGPFAELLPIDVEAVQCGVDAFFQQLSDLSEEWRGAQVLEKLAPWLLAAGVAGYGWVRLRDRRNRCLADRVGSDQSGTVPTIFLSGGEG